MAKTLLIGIVLVLSLLSILNIALGYTIPCAQCRLEQCDGVGYDDCGRTIICTGHCSKGTEVVSYTMCVQAGPSDECERIGTIGCGPREISPCSGWPSCNVCDDYKKDGFDIYVPSC
jgi:hypothetical protein